jgi:hypothetical protein
MKPHTLVVSNKSDNIYRQPVVHILAPLNHLALRVKIMQKQPGPYYKHQPQPDSFLFSVISFMEGVLKSAGCEVAKADI